MSVPSVPSIRGIFSFNGEYPDNLFDRFVMVCEKLAPYEELSPSHDRQVAWPDYYALIELMITAGVFDTEFHRDLQDTAVRIRRFCDGAHGYLQDQHYRKYDRFIARFDRAICARQSRLLETGRPLAFLFLREVLHASYTRSLVWMIRRFGIEKLKERRGNDLDRANPEQAEALDWFCVASDLRAYGKPALPMVQRGVEAFSLLKDSCFEPTSEEGVAGSQVIAIDQWGFPWYARYYVMQDMHPMVLTLVGLHRKNGPVVARGMISRVTGRLIGAGMFLLPMSVPFVVYRKNYTHIYVQQRLLDDLLRVVMDGKLRERSFVDETELPEPQVPEDTVLPEPELDVAEEFNLLSDQALSVIPEIETLPPLPLLKEGVWRFRRLTWQRIMSTFRRCGVEILVGGTHPKLRFGGATTRFLNSHERDTRHNRQELFRALRELNIPRDTFFAALK